MVEEFAHLDNVPARLLQLLIELSQKSEPSLSPNDLECLLNVEPCRPVGVGFARLVRPAREGRFVGERFEDGLR